MDFYGRARRIDRSGPKLSRYGELHGRAREVARALESVLIGNRRGKVTDKAPRCGLALAMDDVFRLLKLPTDEIKEIRLDVLRDARDRARAVVLRHLTRPISLCTTSRYVGTRQSRESHRGLGGRFSSRHQRHDRIGLTLRCDTSASCGRDFTTEITARRG